MPKVVRVALYKWTHYPEWPVLVRAVPGEGQPEPDADYYRVSDVIALDFEELPSSEQNFMRLTQVRREMREELRNHLAKQKELSEIERDCLALTHENSVAQQPQED